MNLLAPVYLTLGGNSSTRRRARHAGLADDGGRCGAVTVVQRFGSACEFIVHLHSIVLDGEYVDEADGRPGFRPLPAPTTAELHALTTEVARKVVRVLRRRGLPDETVLEDAAADEPALTELLGESVAFPRARVVDPGRARPDDRLSLREDSRVALQLETPWACSRPMRGPGRRSCRRPVSPVTTAASRQRHWSCLCRRRPEPAGTCFGMSSCGGSSRSTGRGPAPLGKNSPLNANPGSAPG